MNFPFHSTENRKLNASRLLSHFYNDDGDVAAMMAALG